MVVVVSAPSTPLRTINTFCTCPLAYCKSAALHPRRGYVSACKRDQLSGPTSSVPPLKLAESVLDVQSLSGFNSVPKYGRRISTPRRLRAMALETAENHKGDEFIEIGTLSRPHGINGEMVVSVDTSFPEERFGEAGIRYIQPPPSRGLFVAKPVIPPREVELVSGRPHVTKGKTVWLVRLKECTSRDAAEELRNFRLLIHKSDRVAVGEDEFYSHDLVGLTVLLNPYHPAASPSASDLSLSSTQSNASAIGSGSHGGDCSSEIELNATEQDEATEFWELGSVADVYDGTGTHGVVRVKFSEGLVINKDGLLERNKTETKVEGYADAQVAQLARTKDSGLLPFAEEIVPAVDLEERVLIVDPPLGWLEMYLTPKPTKKRRTKKRKSPKTPPVEISRPVAISH